jgi:hypothetical protein
MQMQVVADAKGRNERLKADRGSATPEFGPHAPASFQLWWGLVLPLLGSQSATKRHGQRTELEATEYFGSVKLERLPRCAS